MPRYIFQILDDSDIIEQDDHDLPDIGIAKCEAVKYAGQLICDKSFQLRDKYHWEMRVADEYGLILFTLLFSVYDAPAIANR